MKKQNILFLMLFTRTILKEIYNELETPEIIILLGSRQTGKTSLLNLLKAKFQDNNNRYIYLDLDIETNLVYFSSYENIIDYIKLQGLNPHNDKIFLLIDEFQRIKNAGKTLKNLYDHHNNLKIIATGSSSIEINKTISESMSGRKIIFRTYPLTYKEFLIFKQRDNLIKIYDNFGIGNDISTTIHQTLEELCVEKILFGAYPGVVLEKKIERKGKKINDILNSYLRKDIREQFGIVDVVQYQKVLEFLGINISNLLNTNKIANQLDTYYRKIENLINIISETYIIDLVRPYFKNRKNEIVRNPKLYFEDTGIRNFLIKNMNTDIMLRNDWGNLVENFVYNELINAIDIFSEIKFFRTKNGTEIDFLIMKNQNILPIEVKSGTSSYIPQSLFNFCKNERLKLGIIVNKDRSECTEKDNISFIFVPYYLSSKIVNLLG